MGFLLGFVVVVVFLKRKMLQKLHPNLEDL